MKAIWFITVRQLRRGGWRSALALGAALLSTILLSGTLLGGQALFDLLVADPENMGPLGILARSAAGVVTVFLVLATGVLIRSSFAASLAQRVRMLGQLASVGATRRQLRLSVYLEAAALGLIAVPAGLISTLVGLGIAFAFLNTNEAFVERFGRLAVPLSPALLGFCVLVALADLLLAAHGPARQAFRVEPMAALRRPADAGSPRRKLRWHIGAPAPSQLARRSLARAGARFRPLAAGIAACVAALVVCTGFIDAVNRAYAADVPTYRYRAMLWGTAGTRPDAILEEIGSWEEKPLVTEETEYRTEPGTAIITFILEDEDFAAWYGEPLAPREGEIPCVESTAGSNLPAEETAPLYQNFTTVLVDSCDTPLPYGAGPTPYTAQNCTIRVTSRSAMEAVTGSENFTLDDRTFLIYADPESGAALTSRLLTLLDEEDFYRYAISDCTPGSEWAQRRVAIPLLLGVFFGGFLVLVLAFCAAGVLGTVGASLALRRRELALLRSAGATLAQLRRMLALEAVSYTAVGALIGLPAGLLFLSAVGNMLWTGLFAILSPLPILSAVGGAALVCALALFLSLHSLKKLSITEALSIGE